MRRRGLVVGERSRGGVLERFEFLSTKMATVTLNWTILRKNTEFKNKNRMFSWTMYFSDILNLEKNLVLNKLSEDVFIRKIWHMFPLLFSLWIKYPNQSLLSCTLKLHQIIFQSSGVISVLITKISNSAGNDHTGKCCDATPNKFGKWHSNSIPPIKKIHTTTNFELFTSTMINKIMQMIG